MELGKGIWQQLKELPKYEGPTKAFGSVLKDAIKDLFDKNGWPEDRIDEPRPALNYSIMSKEEKALLKENDTVGIGTSWGIVWGTYPSILGMDTHVNLWGGDTLESKTAMADLYKINK